VAPSELDVLERQRAYECRLTADRALATFEDAEAFLTDRGLLTRTSDSYLPSLFEACHEAPYRERGRGFASWPRTKWSWAGELEALAGVTVLKIHRGKNLSFTRATLTHVDPICRAELTRFLNGPSKTRFDRDTLRLLTHLAEAGPSTLDSLQAELSLSARDLKAIRYPLERCGALVARQTTPGADKGGHTHTSELSRYDQLVPQPLNDLSVETALKDLVVAGVRAAVFAEERELRRWFSWSWYWRADFVDALVSTGRLRRPAPGYVALGTATSGASV
jgi:hypothetical protein